MLQQQTFIGDLYGPPAHIRPLIEQVLADGRPRYTPLYQDENGTYVSGYAPIRDGAGRVVAILEVDYTVDRFLAELYRGLSRKLWLLPAALVLALILSALVARSITAAVSQLVAGTLAVQQGRYDHRVLVETRDELHTLAEAFNAMLLYLRERFAMLKFLPRHTRQVIADAVKDHAELAPDLVAGRREVTVLFSDIRGFTAWSETLPPDRVIGVLNLYLSRQAALVEQHGGSIDKFIGDAVMALFMGPERERVARAVQAALAMQGALGEIARTQALESQLSVGIGIADGEVVMGNLGYEDRLEFAVIGRDVNLASRLTGLAGAGEIVISEPAFLALAGRFPGERIEGVRIKGFIADITCYRISPAATG
jgi:adenylate cyclase